jgi:hypothetical protein
LQHADGGKGTDTRTQGRTADAQLFCEISFRRQSIARTQLAAMDHLAKLRHDSLETRAAPLGVNGFEDI